MYNCTLYTVHCTDTKKLCCPFWDHKKLNILNLTKKLGDCSVQYGEGICKFSTKYIHF